MNFDTCDMSRETDLAHWFADSLYIAGLLSGKFPGARAEVGVIHAEPNLMCCNTSDLLSKTHCSTDNSTLSMYQMTFVLDDGHGILMGVSCKTRNSHRQEVRSVHS